MEENTQHFPHITLYHFKKGKNATEMQKKVCAAYGEGAVTDWTCQNGLRSFVLEISHWVVLHSRPVEVDSDQIETLIESNQCYTTWEIADILKISKSINKVIDENEKRVLFYGN